MQPTMKKLFKVDIPYWKNKQYEIALLKRIEGQKKDWYCSFMRMDRLTDIPGYEEEWGIKEISYLTLWKNY